MSRTAGFRHLAAAVGIGLLVLCADAGRWVDQRAQGAATKVRRWRDEA